MVILEVIYLQKWPRLNYCNVLQTLDHTVYIHVYLKMISIIIVDHMFTFCGNIWSSRHVKSRLAQQKRTVPIKFELCSNICASVLVEWVQRGDTHTSTLYTKYVQHIKLWFVSQSRAQLVPKDTQTQTILANSKIFNLKSHLLTAFYSSAPEQWAVAPCKMSWKNSHNVLKASKTFRCNWQEWCSERQTKKHCCVGYGSVGKLLCSKYNDDAPSNL